MIDELKNEQLTEEEMSGVVGGVIYGKKEFADTFLVTEEDERIWSTFTNEEKRLVRTQSGRAAQKAKMIEIYRQKG